MLSRNYSIQWYCCFVAFNTVESLIFKSSTSSKVNPQEFKFFLRFVLTLLLRQKLEPDFAALREIQTTPSEVWAHEKASHENYLNIKKINHLQNCSCS